MKKEADIKDFFSFESEVVNDVILKCNGVGGFPEKILLSINGKMINLSCVSRINVMIEAGEIPRITVEY